MRYKVIEETTRNGRKKEVYYAIYDSFKSGVVFRSSDKIEAEFICDRMNDRVEEMKQFGSNESGSKYDPS